MSRRGLGPATALALLLLCGCDDAGDGGGERAAEQAPSAAASDLDALALESGALPDRAGIDPAGSYGRNYDGGRDRFCLVPDGNARGRYRFGAEMRIGQDEYCRGRGTAKLSADKLLLRFEGQGEPRCMIVARYEGDQLVMPGALDVSCAQLCSSRGSFAGVTFPRVDRDPAQARRLTGADGTPLCR